MHPKRLQDPQAKRPKVPDKDLDRLVQAAWDAGWWCKRMRNNHVKCMAPQHGDVVPVPSTPSDVRTLRNKRAQFRRAGLEV